MLTIYVHFFNPSFILENMTIYRLDAIYHRGNNVGIVVQNLATNFECTSIFTDSFNMARDQKQINFGSDYFAWKKIYEREKRFFHIRTDFIPDLKAKCITGKFYSTHDVVQKEDADQNFVSMIEIACAKGPKDCCEHPQTENQRYGWYPELQAVQKLDPRLYHAHQKSHITWLAEQILLGTRDMPKSPPFTGIPFKS